MEPYDSRVTAIRAAVERVSKTLRRDVKGQDRKTYSEELGHFKKVVTFVKSSIEHTDPALVSAAAEQSIVSAAEAITSDVVAALEDVSRFADALADASMLLPGARNRDLEQAAAAAATQFESSLSEPQGRVEADLERNTEELSALRKEIEDASTEFHTKVEASRTVLQGSIESLAESISTNQTTLDGQLTRHSETFAANQEVRDTEFRARVRTFNELTTKAIEKAEKEARARVDELDRIVREAGNLEAAYAQHVIADQFDLERQQQRVLAEVFRGLTILFALCAAGAAILSIFHEPDEPSSVAAKLAVSVIFGGLAGYTARQSGRHQRREARARKLQLELTAFGPFVEPLGTEQKEEERVILARKTFTGGTGTDEETFRDPGPAPISFLMKERLKQLEDGEA
jgi:hypothetical protein